MRVDPRVDLSLEYQLHQLVLQLRHRRVERRRHLTHVRRQVRAEILRPETPGETM